MQIKRRKFIGKVGILSFTTPIALLVRNAYAIPPDCTDPTKAKAISCRREQKSGSSGAHTYTTTYKCTVPTPTCPSAPGDFFGAFTSYGLFTATGESTCKLPEACKDKFPEG